MNKLVDHARKKMGFKSDYALAKHLGIGAPAISKLRHKTSPLTSNLILLFYDKCGLSIELIRALAVEE